MSTKLLLFDIDCTLIDTGGAGMSALKEAAKAIFGGEGPPLDLAGSTDGGIVRNLFEHFDQPYDAKLEDTFYQDYLVRLQRNLNHSDFGGRILDGVSVLLETLMETEHTLGLLTGNITAGAAVKTKHYGLDHYFRFGSYGDDHWDRNLLGPIAIERSGKEFASHDVIVIGDTPKDIACAKACGAKSVAVATGKFTKAELLEYEPDLVLLDLASEQILDQILA